MLKQIHNFNASIKTSAFSVFDSEDFITYYIKKTVSFTAGTRDSVSLDTSG